jgi:hypothetical protein
MNASAFPIYIWEAEDGTQFYGFPHQEGPPLHRTPDRELL